MKKNIVFLSFIFTSLLFTSCSEKDKNKMDKNEVKTVQEKKVYNLKLATTWGTSAVPLINAPLNLAKMVNKMSDGRLIIRVDSSNKHKSPLGILDMVKAGQYDLGHSTSYFWKGKDIETLPLTTMPFGMTANELYSWFYYGGGLDLMQKVYEKHDVLSFPGGNTGVQMGGWFKKEIKTLDDLKGLKMRIPGFAGEIMSELGVLVTNLAPGELYTSLERGTIDALEWVGPAMDIKMGFHKIAPYYYTGWHEPGAETQYLVNKKVFNKLPKDLQEILLQSMRVSAYDMFMENNHLSGIALQDMLKNYPNISIQAFPKEVMDEMKRVNLDLREKISKKSVLLKEILEHQDNYLKQVRPWTEMSDYLFLKDNLSK
ncbi:MAG: TRAP transporter substrate-binding protein [Campylobacteraceae bacterium]|nr:TRAP transporter substrate-binding protein [Campylobacteraceae bacterium]